MRLGQQAISVLDDWGSFSGDDRELVVQSDRLTIRSRVTAADTLSCSLRSLALEPLAPRSLGTDELRAWGQRIGQRVRYMLEAIETVELDSTQRRLLLRSTPPEKRATGTLYYELLLEGTGRLELSRRRYDPKDRSRSSELLNCTRELLEKLVDDLAATAPQ